MSKQLLDKIVNIPEVGPDEVDLQMMAEMEDDDAEESIGWGEYTSQREERTYNGNISLRIPKELHRKLVGTAKEQGVSLNQYCLYKLAR